MSQSQTVATLEDFKALKAQASRKAAWNRDGVNKPERFLLEVGSMDALKKAITLIDQLGVALSAGASLNLNIDFESKVDAKILALSIANAQAAASPASQAVKKRSLILPTGKALDNAWIPYIEDCDGVMEVTPSPIGLKVSFDATCDWDEVLAIWNRLIA